MEPSFEAPKIKSTKFPGLGHSKPKYSGCSSKDKDKL